MKILPFFNYWTLSFELYLSRPTWTFKKCYVAVYLDYLASFTWKFNELFLILEGEAGGPADSIFFNVFDRVNFVKVIS